eukprot:294722_1
MVFNSFIAKFNHPTSTTKNIVVATRFATNSGIIIEICAYRNIPCFECSWISTFANENESLFFGGFSALKIVNIINCVNGQQYKMYLHAISQLQYCITNWKQRECTKQDVAILDSLICNKSSVPEYAQNTFKAFTSSVKKIIINGCKIAEGNEVEYFLSLLLTDNHSGVAFVNLKTIQHIFPKVEQIILTGGQYEICIKYINKVSKLLNEYNIRSLKQIIIRDYIVVEWIQISKTEKVKGIEFIYNAVKKQFHKSTKFTLDIAANEIYFTRNNASDYKKTVKRTKTKHSSQLFSKHSVKQCIKGTDNWCFDGNSMVLMANGTYKKISQIKVGDQVISFPNDVSTVKCSIVSSINKHIEMVNLNALKSLNNEEVD